MTAIMRQIGKQCLTLLCVLLGLVLPAAAEGPIVTDPLSGVAVEGYDPVSYFIGPEPVPGLPAYEYEWQGVPWYFASAANRDVFKRNPEVYAPQFGGHCAMGVARGHLSEGRPGIYLVEGARLYLFYSAGNREAFRVGRPQSRADSETNWQHLSQDQKRL
jgi:YHS domain-containing protein